MARVCCSFLSAISWLLTSNLPHNARGLVIEWAAMHQEELREAFQKAATLQAPGKIEPLP
jgi:hypothetical protein